MNKCFTSCFIVCNSHIDISMDDYNTSTVLPAYLVPVYLVTRLSRHFFQSPLPLTYVIFKPDISSSGYLVMLTSVRALTR